MNRTEFTGKRTGLCCLAAAAMTAGACPLPKISRSGTGSGSMESPVMERTGSSWNSGRKKTDGSLPAKQAPLVIVPKKIPFSGRKSCYTVRQNQDR